jgi:hypothetical protein
MERRVNGLVIAFAILIAGQGIESAISRHPSATCVCAPEHK